MDGGAILVEVLRHFAELEPDFPERYSHVVRNLGRKRPYVARTREDLYSGKPDLLVQTTKFAPGWFVGTNESNEKKLALLRCACQVIGLKWKRDLIVKMP